MWRTTLQHSLDLIVVNISIPVLRVEDDPAQSISENSTCLFQSPSSVWRTTHANRYYVGKRLISIPVLRVEDDLADAIGQARQDTISIPVLRVEDDRSGCMGRAACGAISIPVLRVEDDNSDCAHYGEVKNFNPRPPCGGRHANTGNSIIGGGFQSPSSVWRTTYRRSGMSKRDYISIPVLRVEDDVYRFALLQFSVIFQSPSSVWRTTP